MTFEIWAVIKFLNKEQIDACKIPQRLWVMHGEDVVVVVNDVHRWVEMFNGGRTKMHDDARDGKPSNTVNQHCQMYG